MLGRTGLKTINSGWKRVRDTSYNYQLPTSVMKTDKTNADVDGLKNNFSTQMVELITNLQQTLEALNQTLKSKTISFEQSEHHHQKLFNRFKIICCLTGIL